MTLLDLAVTGADVLLPDGQRPCTIGIRGGKFVEPTEPVDWGRCSEVLDATGLVAMPGIIDAHNHPYYDDDMVEFATAAAYGGVTSLASFAGIHLNTLQAQPPSAVTVADDFISRASGATLLDFAVHAIVGSGDEPDLTVRRLTDLGIRSIKIFLAFPGQRMVDDATALAFMQAAARHDVLCMVHCENGSATDLLERQAIQAGRTSAAAYASSRPAALEAEAVYRALALAETAGCTLYLVHISCAQSLDVIDYFRNRGNIPIYVETCPHYLLLDSDDLNRLGGLAKISPPLRTSSDIEALWQAIHDQVVDVIASDCSGQRAAPKRVDDIFQAPYGIPGVEHMLPLMWDEAVNRRGLPPSLLADVMSRNPAQIFRLAGKGRIAPGADADLSLVDPRATWTVHARDQHGNSDYSLYEGRTLVGRPVHTIAAGRHLLRAGALPASARHGQYLSR